MTQEELFLAVRDCAERNDVAGVFDLAYQVGDEPWRSKANKLVVDMVLDDRYQCWGVDAAGLAYSYANTLITDPTLRLECMFKIATVAAKHQDWETVRRASHRALLGIFQGPKSDD